MRRDVKTRAYNDDIVTPSLLGRSWVPYLAAAVIITVLVRLLRLVPATDAGAVAPLLLLAVLIIARTWGTGPALGASVTASLAYSYFFLPPAGFGIEDPNDWVGFVTFTGTAIIVGELAARAERRHLEAQAGRREIERLYQQLQAAFDRASEAEAARRNEKLKAALLDALTHNLRTPLTSIKAAVTALIGDDADGDAGLSGEGRRDLLQVIDEESDRLNRFIEGLSAAGTTDGSQPLAFPPIDLHDIVQAAVTRAETLTLDHRVVVSLQDGLPPVSVDRAAVTEVIYILLDNASKYAAPRTAIGVTAERGDGPHVRVGVSDEGPGIVAEFRERVFDSFFRIPGRESRDPRRVGVGLGLSIARRLVEAQTGRLWIESPSSGPGTTFRFTLPAAVEAVSNRESSTTVSPQMEKHDDNGYDRQISSAGGRR